MRLKCRKSLQDNWGTDFWEPGHNTLSQYLKVDTLKEWAKLSRKKVIRRLKYGERTLDFVVERFRKCVRHGVLHQWRG